MIVLDIVAGKANESRRKKHYWGIRKGLNLKDVSMNGTGVCFFDRFRNVCSLVRLCSSIIGAIRLWEHAWPRHLSSKRCIRIFIVGGRETLRMSVGMLIRGWLNDIFDWRLRLWELKFIFSSSSSIPMILLLGIKGRSMLFGGLSFFQQTFIHI